MNPRQDIESKDYLTYLKRVFGVLLAPITLPLISLWYGVKRTADAIEAVL